MQLYFDDAQASALPLPTQQWVEQLYPSAETDPPPQRLLSQLDYAPLLHSPLQPTMFVIKNT